MVGALEAPRGVRGVQPGAGARPVLGTKPHLVRDSSPLLAAGGPGRVSGSGMGRVVDKMTRMIMDRALGVCSVLGRPHAPLRS